MHYQLVSEPAKPGENKGLCQHLGIKHSRVKNEQIFILQAPQDSLDAQMLQNFQKCDVVPPKQ